MFRIRHTIAAAIMALGFISAPLAMAGTDQQNLVDRARIAVDDLRKDQEFGNARQLLRSAKGVLIVPSLVKGGFFFGGEGGEGVLLTRDPQNEWSHPAFYTLASASFGLQIGLEESELVLIVMTERALADFMADEFKIGAQAGLAIVTLGSEAEASVTSNFKPDIIVWSSATGAYAGLTLNGSLIKPRDTWNEAYYGQPESVPNIVSRRAVQNPGAAALRQELASISR
jgi:lipid-binding SYLF domain-containing protein